MKIMTIWYYIANILSILTVVAMVVAFAFEVLALIYGGYHSGKIWTDGLVLRLMPYVGILILHGVIMLGVVWKYGDLPSVRWGIIIQTVSLIIVAGFLCMELWNNRRIALEKKAILQKSEERYEQSVQRITDEKLKNSMTNLQRNITGKIISTDPLIISDDGVREILIQIKSGQGDSLSDINSVFSSKIGDVVTVLGVSVISSPPYSLKKVPYADVISVSGEDGYYIKSK